MNKVDSLYNRLCRDKSWFTPDQSFAFQKQTGGWTWMHYSFGNSPVDQCVYKTREQASFMAGVWAKEAGEDQGVDFSKFVFSGGYSVQDSDLVIFNIEHKWVLQLGFYINETWMSKEEEKVLRKVKPEDSDYRKAQKQLAQHYWEAFCSDYPEGQNTRKQALALFCSVLEENDIDIEAAIYVTHQHWKDNMA